MRTRPRFRPLVLAYALALAAAPLAAGVAGAQTGPSTVGTILIAHGGSPQWNALVERIVSEARTGGPVAVSFLMGEAAKTTRFQDVAAKLVAQGVQEIVVVPMLVSSHSGHYEQLRWLVGATDTLDETMMHHLHHAGIDRASVKVPVRLTRAIDDSPEIARVLADRAKALATSPKEQALFLVAHGPNSAEDYAQWMRNLRPVADSVKAMLGFRDVRVDMVRDDAPAPVRAEAVKRVRELIELQAALTGKPVVVVPVLISKGRVSDEKFVADLKGLPIVYSGEPLLPHPGLARWVESRVREAAAVGLGTK